MILAKIGRKISRLGQTIENYKLLRIRQKGLSIDGFLRLNQPWLLEANINTVFDIGGNVGEFASLIHEVLPMATIYSFEPLEDCYGKLLNRMKNVYNFKAFNLALGETNGQLTMYRNKHLPSSSMLPMANLHRESYPHTAKYTIIKITSARLDDVVKKLKLEDNLLIKIDVQGFEDKVISGGEKTIRQATILIIESSFRPLYVGQPLFEDIYDSLKEHFRYMGSLGESRMSLIDGTPLFEDSIFVRKSVKPSG